jgi:hypothetical protein
MFQINYVPIILAGLLSLGSFLAGWSFNGNRWEAKFSSYKAGIEKQVSDQEVRTKALVKEQELITKSTKETYEVRIAALKRLYGGVQHSQGGPSAVSSVPESTKGTDGPTSDLVLNCALTTQQLTSLQDWITKQIGADHGKNY